MMVSSFTDAGSIKSFPAVVADHPTKCYHFPLFFRGLIEAKRTEGMNYIKPAAMIPVDTTVSSSFGRSIGHAFTVRIRTENQNQASFYPFVPHEISVLVELILGHLRYLLTDVPPQPNSPPDNVLRRIDREASLGSKEGVVTRLRFTDSKEPFPVRPRPTRRSLATLAAQAAANSRRVGTGTPSPALEPILFRSYGSILPTSLAYIVPSTRGCSPWRPDAVMKCDRAWRLSVLRFSRARECTDTTRRAVLFQPLDPTSG
ncbi:hypothetical protein Bca4012_103110 [Brassica carinata]